MDREQREGVLVFIDLTAEVEVWVDRRGRVVAVAAVDWPD